MDDDVMYDGEILVTKHDMFHKPIGYAKGKFFIENEVYFVEIDGEDESPFGDYHHTNLQFTGTVQIDEPGMKETFVFPMLPNPSMTEFEVIEDNNFTKMKKFFDVLNLAKSLENKSEVKTQKRKI